MGALVEIAEVNLARPLPAELHDGFLDLPRAGGVLDANVVDVFGWAVGAEAEAVAVEFSSGGRAIWRAPLRTRRPDLADAFPEHPEAASAGFRTTIDLIGTPPEFELDVAVVLADRRRAQLATVRGRHRWRRQSSPAFAELVSVVITCTGGTDALAGAIESVLAQGCPRLEIVIADDTAGDEAADIASRYPGIRRVRGEKDLGLARARNLGIRATNGDFLTFLDAAERLPPRAVEAGLRALEQRPECAAATGSAGFPPPLVYRRSLFEHLRTFDPRLGDAAGLGFDLAVARKFPVAGLPAPDADAGEKFAQLLGEKLTGQARRSLRELRFRDALREVALLSRHRLGALPTGSNRSRPG